MAGDVRPCVLVYRRQLLKFSETFILRQVSSMTRWRPVLAGTPIAGGLAIDSFAHHEIRLPETKRPRRKSAIARLVRKITRGNEPYVDPYLLAQATAEQLRRADWFRELSKEAPRLLHVHFGTNAEEAWPLAIALCIPMVVTLHGFDASTYATWWESGKGRPRFIDYPATLRAMEAKGTAFIAVSDAIAESATEYGLSRSSCRKILIGIDTTAIEPGTIAMSERPPRILFVGRFVEKKGLHFLLNAFQHVLMAIPEAELRIVGEGKLGNELKALAISTRITFVGRKTNNQVLAEMRGARVLCVPSVRAENGDSEGLPTVIFEAQACGLPVVTSARGGRTEGIIDGVTGIVFPERDTVALAEALVRCLKDNAFAASAAIASRNFAVAQLDLRRHTNLLEKYYDEVLATRGQIT